MAIKVHPFEVVGVLFGVLLCLSPARPGAQCRYGLAGSVEVFDVTNRWATNYSLSFGPYGNSDYGPFPAGIGPTSLIVRSYPLW